MSGFVCISYGNTGSSWLIDAINASPDVLIPGYEPLETWAWDAPAQDRLEWLRTALTPPTERLGMSWDAWVGALQASPQATIFPDKPSFKQTGVKVNDLAVFETEAVIGVLRETGAKAIVLTRANRLKHALSMYRFHEERRSQFALDEARAPSRVRLWRFHRWVRESKRLHRSALRVTRDLMAAFGSDRVATVEYEEFVSVEGKRATIDRLWRFLGVQPVALGSGAYAKATPDDLRSAVANYDTLRRRYRWTALRRWL